MFEKLIEILKENPRKIVFTEGPDARILEAADRLKKGGFLTPVLVGNVEEVQAAAKAGNFDIEGLEILDPLTYEDMDAMVAKMVELRKGKMTEEQCTDALKKGNYFGTMLVKMGVADALLGGATYSTADTVRPALQLIKTKPGSKSVSSCFIMVREKEDGTEILGMGDCAINIKPSPEEIAECAVETARTASIFGVDPKVAMLSYSTKGSGAGEDVDKMVEATKIAKEQYPDLVVDGEFQLDAAIVPSVAKSKAPNSDVAGKANVLIFPNLDAGNIAYKIVQRLAKADAYGPILQGIAKPVNDLSRGCSAEDIVGVIAITVVQAMAD